MIKSAPFLIGAVFLCGIGPAFAQAAISDTQIMEIHDRILTIDSHTDIGPGYGTAKLDPGVLNQAQLDLPSRNQTFIVIE